MMRSLLLVVLLCCSASFTLGAFDFQQQDISQWNVWGRIDSYIYPTVAPLYYPYYSWVDNATQTEFAPVGSWLLYGRQPDVLLSTNEGATWNIISGLNWLNLDPREAVNGLGNTWGSSGCAHRGGFNRWYYIGSNDGAVPWYNWATSDGSSWINILDVQTQVAFNTRSLSFDTQCFVDMRDTIFHVGGNDTWLSTNLGVTFTKLPSRNHFSAREQYVGGIYTPIDGVSPDVIVIVGGDSATGMLNDVWRTTDRAVTWTKIANGPWSPRRNMDFAISVQGFMVASGGNCGGGWCGLFADMYVSLDGGFGWTLLNRLPATGFRTFSSLIFDRNSFLHVLFGQKNSSATNNYAWTTDHWKSTLAVHSNAIYNWGAQVDSSATSKLRVPSFEYAIASSSDTSTRASSTYTTYLNIVEAVALNIPSMARLPTATYPTTGKSSSPAFDFTQIDSRSWGVWGRVDSNIRATVAPLVYPVPNASYTGIGAWAVAPTGSWLLWGTQPDVSISTDQGRSWNIIAGVQYLGLNPDSYASFGWSYGSDGCAHRNTFNRFYLMGNTAFRPYYNWASDNGWEWFSILSPATSAAWDRRNLQRDDSSYDMCVVDLQDRVYNVGNGDMWVSTDLGVTFTPVATRGNYFPARDRFGGDIWTPDVQKADQIIIMGGNTVDGSASLNDVWRTDDLGVTWVQVTNAAQWSKRGDINFALSDMGIMVVYAGSLLGGYGGWYDDVWVSLDGGYAWSQVAQNVAQSSRSQSTMVFDVNGYLYSFFGQTPPSYNWTTDGWKSTYSFHNYLQWAPALAANIPTSCPGGGTGSDLTSSSSSLSGGAVAGIVIGGVVGVLILVLMIAACLLGWCTGGAGKSSGKKTAYEGNAGAGAAGNTQFNEFDNSAAEHSQTASTHHDATGEVEMHSTQ